MLARIISIVLIILFTIGLIVGLYFLLFKKNPIEVRGGDSVILKLQALNRFETSQFTIEKIIDAGTTGNRFQEVLFGDRILLVAHGEVIAGFDMSRLSMDQIEVDGSTVKLALPPPQILVSRLDNEKTRVYDRRQGFLTQGNKDLESTARSEAEKSIRQASCEGGILTEASDNARSQLTTLIQALGYTTVIVEIPSGSC